MEKKWYRHKLFRKSNVKIRKNNSYSFGGKMALAPHSVGSGRYDVKTYTLVIFIIKFTNNVRKSHYKL